MHVSLRLLLTLSGSIEALGGVLALIDPATVTEVLLGSQAGTGAIVLARFLGAAMFSLGLACLQVRDHVASPAGLAVVYSITSYNVVAAVVIVWTAESLGAGGFILKAAGLGHAALGLLLVRGILILTRERPKVNA